jgi:hypothetical protein
MAHARVESKGSWGKGAGMRTGTGVALICLLALAGQASYAAEALKVHKQGGSTYVTGGGDDGSRAALREVAPRYPIHLIFMARGETTGVTGVKVTLFDLRGDAILEAVSEGPYLYINPPSSGRYTVEAELNGEKQRATKDLIGRRYLVFEYDFGKG